MNLYLLHTKISDKQLTNQELLCFQQFVITKLLNILRIKNIYPLNVYLCSIENNSLNKCSDSRKKDKT